MTLVNEKMWKKSTYCESSGCVEVAWAKSSRSLQTNCCVEVGVGAGKVLVRDSKDAAGPVLAFTAQAWTEFIAAAKLGEFD